jgi:hypothetical protein
MKKGNNEKVLFEFGIRSGAKFIHSFTKKGSIEGREESERNTLRRSKCLQLYQESEQSIATRTSHSPLPSSTLSFGLTLDTLRTSSVSGRKSCSFAVDLQLPLLARSHRLTLSSSSAKEPSSDESTSNEKCKCKPTPRHASFVIKVG